MNEIDWVSHSDNSCWDQISLSHFPLYFLGHLLKY